MYIRSRCSDYQNCRNGMRVRPSPVNNDAVHSKFRLQFAAAHKIKFQRAEYSPGQNQGSHHPIKDDVAGNEPH